MPRPHYPRLATLAVAVLAVSGASAPAGFIPGVTATTNMGTFATYSLPNLTNGQGLSSLALTATHNAEFPDMWMSGGAIQVGWLVFDLKAVYSLDTVVVWNYNSTIDLNRGVKDFNLEASLDGTNYTSLLDTSTLAMGTGSQTLPGQSFVLDGSAARYVRLNVESNYGPAENPYVGLSEVQFGGERGPQAVPVPPSAVLLALGMAGIGVVVRRSRRPSLPA